MISSYSKFKYSSCIEAAKANDLKELIEMHQCGYYLLKFTCLTAAVKHDNVEMLDYLLRHTCSIDRSLTITIAENNSTKVLHYLIENNILSTNATNDIQLEWHPDTTDYVVKYNDLKLLKYYIDNGCPMSDQITVYAAKYGYLEFLKYAVEKGAYKHPNAIKYAVMNNQKECLYYLINQQFTITSDITIYAGMHNRLEILKYLIDVCKVKWNPETTYLTALSGNIEILMYCFQNGCPKHLNTFIALHKLDDKTLKLDLNNINLRSFVFELYHSHPELRFCYFGERIKEEMDAIEMKKSCIQKYVSKYVCDDVIQYCIFNFI